MRVSGRNLNKKDESNRPAQAPAARFPVSEQSPFQTHQYQTNHYPPPVRRSGLSPAIIVLIVLISIPALLAVVGIIAAIAVPNLLASRQAANMARATSDLRAIHTAQKIYYPGFGNKFGTIEELIAVNLLDKNIRRPNSMYVLTLTRSSAALNRYCAAANSTQFPKAYGIDASGVMRVAEKGGIECRDGELSGAEMVELK